MALKNNKIFRIVAISIACVLCFLGKFIRPIPGLSQDAMGVLFIFVGCLFLWLTIGIDWPSILCIVALGFIDSVGFKSVFQNSFGNATFIFLLFTFVCTYALSKTSLLKRTAIFFINLKIAKKSGFRFLTLFLIATLFLGLFISPSVLFVVMLPIVNEIFNIAKIEKGDKIAKAMMLGLGFTVSISSGMTTIAHVFPILAINASHSDISPLQYMAFAIPTGLVIFIFMLFMLWLVARKDSHKLANVDVSLLKKELPKINGKDIATLIIFILVIVLWIVPSLFQNIWPDFYQFFNKYGTAMPPLIGTFLLCIIRFNNEPLIKIDKALKEGIPWGSLLMCAATLALGAALTSDAVGIKSFLTSSLNEPLKQIHAIWLLIIFICWAALQTNVSSNMVTATLVASVAYGILSSGDIKLNIPVTCAIIGMMASFAFATPPSMPHIAIVAGSEYCTTKDVLIYGGILMIFSAVAALLVAYPLGSLIIN